MEWRLSELYWMTQGTRGFMEDQVPYLVTSGGTLASDAAEVLFANCLDARPTGELVVLDEEGGWPAVSLCESLAADPAVKGVTAVTPLPGLGEPRYEPLVFADFLIAYEFLSIAQSHIRMDAPGSQWLKDFLDKVEAFMSQRREKKLIENSRQ